MEPSSPTYTPVSTNGALPPLLPTQALPWAVPADDEWDLRRFLMVMQRRSLTIAGVATLVMGFVIQSTFSQKPVYEGKFRLLVEPVNANNSLSSLTSALGTLSNDKSLSQTNLDYDTQIQVLRSPELMNGVVKSLQLRYPQIDYNSLMERMTIVRPGETKILEVRFQGSSPTEIQIILNTLSKAYLEYSLVERQTNLRQGIQFIDKQLPGLKDDVENLQDELQLFRQQNEFIDPDSQASQVTGKVSNIEQQRLAIDQELAKARSYFDTLQGQAGAVAALNDAPVYQNLIGELRKIETQISAELTRFKPGNINIRVLEEKRDNLLPLLRQEAQRVLGIKLAEATTQIQILEVRSQSLVQARAQSDQQVRRLPALARRYTDLQRELQVSVEALNRFLSNRQTLQVQAAQTEIPWQIIETAQLPESPISPNIPRNLVLGLLASTLLGIGAALLLEKLDNVFHTVEDLKGKTKLPVLGSLPIIRDLAEVDSGQARNWLSRIPLFSPPFRSISGYSRYLGDSGFLEALRVLHTNIQLLGSDRSVRSLIISSAMPGDGKSTVSTYLAQTAAAMGKRVLLIDADLRKPQVHHRLNLPNELGLSNLITNDLKISQVLQRPESVPGLNVITAGQIPPDPTKLFASRKMQSMMDKFQQSFDLVIYDAPPLLGLADASLLAPHTDGLVIVVRIGKTDRAAVSQALESLKPAQISILGIVANQVRRSFESYTYQQYQGSSSTSRPEPSLTGSRNNE
jgi:polysaccharide biosynthesis transport protein